MERRRRLSIFDERAAEQQRRWRKRLNRRLKCGLVKWRFQHWRWWWNRWKFR
jgi:hypothetical protein